LTSATVFSVIFSLSRSFWLGGIAGAAFAAIMLLVYFRVGWERFTKFAMIIILIVAAEIGAFYLVSRTAGRSEAVGSRLENPIREAAGGARLLLLPGLLTEIKQSPFFGKGFGQEVTYSSYLPDRVTSDNPEGKITSFAFEWGYLDIILKIGLLGFVIYLIFIANIFKQGWSNLQFFRLPSPAVQANGGQAISNFQTNTQIPNFKFQILGVLSGLVALIVLNITTPYLNHPLGIGYLLLSLMAFRNYD